MKSEQTVNWLLFIILSFIWGSSFILMKEGLHSLNAYHVASLRMLSGGVVLLPVAFKQWGNYSWTDKKWILLSGLLGSFLPAYLFCIAETRISSALAGFLNSTTPILTMIIGALIFRTAFTRIKWIGVVTGLSGMALLFLSERADFTNLLFSLLVLIATICYAMNANLAAAKLKAIGPTNIASLAFAMLIPPSLIALAFTGFFSLDFSSASVLYSIGASSLLGIAGTAIATILFYRLLKRAGALFASMVTYGIPFVALLWGLIAGETIHLVQIIGLVIILAGVMLANYRKT
jgi:drug/metabolite transporter (DMT)-like permease